MVCSFQNNHYIFTIKKIKLQQPSIKYLSNAICTLTSSEMRLRYYVKIHASACFQHAEGSFVCEHKEHTKCFLTHPARPPRTKFAFRGIAPGGTLLFGDVAASLRPALPSFAAIPTSNLLTWYPR